MIQQFEITLPLYRRGYHLVTRTITDQLPALPEVGLINLLLKHTSASADIE
jgi:thiamine phosphate synthase YjbQ (UPF0047 family)